MTPVFLPDDPLSCAYNLRAEASLIQHSIDDITGRDLALSESDLRRIAKTLRRAADLLDPPHAR